MSTTDSSITPRRLLAAGASLLVLAGALPAVAGDPVPDASGDDQGAQLAEIVVTARRRAENLQEVPIALTVIGGEQLDRTNTYNVALLTQLAPTVQLLSSNARNTAITIRGVGASYGLANDGLEQGVGVYIDQVYYARPATATLDFIDLQQVEILRGPQGTLFGKNTTAGALNITTRDAASEPAGLAELTVGDLGFLQAKATVTGPIVGDTLTGRLSLVSTRRDGIIENVRVNRDQNEQNNVGLRGQLRFRPNETLTVRAYGDWNRQELECCTQVFVRVGETLKPEAQQFEALAAGRGYVPPSRDPYDRIADVDADIQADQWQAGGSVIVDYDFRGLRFTSISAYREWDWEPANDRDYIGLDIVRQSANPSQQDQTSQEFRLSSLGDRRLDWVIGAYVFNQTVFTDGVTEWGRDATYWLLGGGLPDALLDGYKAFNVSTIETTSYAAFGQLNWDITDRLRVTPGLRYTDEEKEGQYELTVEGGLETTNSNEINRRLSIARPQSYEAAISDGSLSGQISVSYDVTEDVLAYASYSRGFKSGGINMAGLPTTAAGLPALTAAEVKPEEVTSYELGLKTQLFDRRVTANAAAFYTDIADFQANVVDAGPGALRGYLANVEKVEIRGVEVDITARPSRALDLYANIAWTDGEYASFKNGPCPLERIGTSTSQCDLSGQALPGVSPWAYAVGGELRGSGALLGLDGELYAGADATYRSTYNSDAAVSRYTEIEGYGLLNLSVGFRSEAGWEAFLSVRNALDKDYLKFVSVQTGNSGLVIGEPGEPRTVAFTLRARY